MRFTIRFLGGMALLVLALVVIAAPTSAMTANHDQNITAITLPPLTHGPPTTTFAVVDMNTIFASGVYAAKTAYGDNISNRLEDGRGNAPMVTGNVVTIGDSQVSTALHTATKPDDNYPNPFNAIPTPNIDLLAPTIAMLGNDATTATATHPAPTTTRTAAHVKKLPTDNFVGTTTQADTTSNGMLGWRNPGERPAPALAA